MAFRVSVYSFTEKGKKLAKEISAKSDLFFRDEIIQFNIEKDADITKESFAGADAHLFIGACGIAVRKIAPFVESKLTDPAVIVSDEMGSFVIPLLSGHIGGANAMAQVIAGVTGGQAVVTTATDINGLRAIDLTAAENGLTVVNKDAIKTVNAKLLKEEVVRVYGDEYVEIICSENKPYIRVNNEDEADVIITSESFYTGNNSSEKNNVGNERINNYKDTEVQNKLILNNKRIIIGIGCRKNTDVNLFEKTINSILSENGLTSGDIERIASIDIKKDELAINSYCKKNNIRFVTFSASELNSICGDFDESEFVKNVTGVSNVCERSAVLYSKLNNYDGRFIVKRMVDNGITISVLETYKKILL